MAIATELTKLNTNILNAYNAISEKGGTVPAQKNTANLSSAIETITGGGGGSDHTIEDSLITRRISGDYTNSRVTEIGISALKDCASLINVDFPNVTVVRDTAFSNCSQLKTVKLPNVETIQGNDIWSGCNKLTAIKLPKLINTTAHTKLFQYTDSLRIVKLPLIERLGADAFLFSFADSAEPLILPNLKTLNDGGEFQSARVKKIYLPSLTSLGGNYTWKATFNINSKLEALVLPGNTVCTLVGKDNAFNSSSITSGTGFIYVPSALVDDYKAATNWSAVANQIRAIEDYPEICAEALKADGTIKTAKEFETEMLEEEA